ncbi:myosin-11 isoform X4 [Lucilia cuprina]|uniref:myosin-11 isoform X4 n=1 Tax=Lucilia cuprina TaxID=7375 RepID=UPI001F066C6F|nr:myosin-11 isoform X4 [Lucilia cuprina]
MDKFYVKPKRSSVSTNPSSSRVNTTASRSSAEIFQTSSNTRRLGVGNICSKIRHKIEDNLTPKISGKLYKTGKHSKSLTALSSIGASTGKYTLTNKNSIDTTSSESREIKLNPNAKSNQIDSSNEKPNPYAECYNVTSKDTSYFTKSSLVSYVDSDEDEAQLSLSIAKTSLEDEIFEELEKVAHDENKLNAVLKTFDKIIFDYNDPQLQTEPNTDEHCSKEKTENVENSNSEGDNKINTLLKIESKVMDNSNLINCCLKSETDSRLQLDCNTNEWKKLEKSSSSLSLNRRKCYQSPDSPCLRQMRHAFAKQQRSKSVWELSNSTKIPILRALPLKTRSKSFCYQKSDGSTHTNNFKSLQSQKTLKTSIQLLNAQEKPVSSSSLATANKKPKSTENNICKPDKKVVLVPPTKNKNTTKTLNKSSSKSLSSKSKRSTTSTPNQNIATNTHINTSASSRSNVSDELLDKCLEKGQQILRKVESLNTQRTQVPSQTKKSIVRTKSNSNKKISKDNLTLKRKQWLHKLNYANEEKIATPPLESCKIIPPVLGETSDKHAELLVQVTNATYLTTNKQRIISEESQLARTHNTTNEHDMIAKNLESDSDDSGHISNENMEIAINHTSHSSSSTSLCEISSSTSSCSATCDISDNNGIVTKSLKMSEVLQKFERKAQKQTTATHSNDNWSQAAQRTEPKILKNNTKAACGALVPHAVDSSSLLPNIDSATKIDSRYCTTYKVAEVESVSVIRTLVEIYPNYTKEILFRSGVLSELEAKRDELLSDRIIQLQAYCRGHLARKAMAQRRVQELAVRCIQRNVKAFLVVRDWPWWRLLVRVMPLLNVHRTEEQLKIANEELLTLRAKLERIENDRNELKTENQKLEAKLSEMTVDLAEERSTANMATERLEAETGERLRLEKELSEKENKVKSLQETTEKLEMELICAKSDLNGISEEEEDLENEDGSSSGSIYKLKYERVAKELEFTKRRLQTQHEHDLEQLIGLKKQLEKKLSDAYEEVEEQRQVVGQWKRKAQKMTNEMNDLRMLLEEQSGRNNLLEKKQRKFDSECQALQDTARQERQSKERLSRENDILIAEKFTLEQSLADTRLELDLKEEKLASLQRELEEMTFGGGTEEEIAQLRRSKNELDRRVKEQEEELDEMAGQVQLLEQAKLRLEMTLETMRKEARREAQQRDEELEEARGSAYKKIKALECQLETEHEERTLLLREKHELERRLSSMEDQDRVDRQAEEAANQKIRRDLRKYKALLKDAHAQLERLKADTPGKTLIRQLRNQLEDAESARTLAMKARQTAEADLAEVQSMYEESNRARNEAEDRANAAQRERTELQAQIEENEEELAELMKKYSAAVKQLNTEQIAASEYEFKLSELEAERNNLKEQITELQHRLENIENLTDPSAAMMSKRLELRTKELESRLELEQATRARLEVQVNRHKEALERLQNEVSQAKVRELQAQDALKKSQKSLRELREEFHVVSGREQESVTKRKDLEKKIEQVESESSALKNDLRLALQRIADLQQAMEEGDEDLTDSEDSQTSDASLSDLEDRLKPIQVRRSSLQKQNGGSVSTTTTLVREKADNSPRITLTSPSSPHIHKLALTAKKLNDDDPKQSLLVTTNIDSLKNGDVS